MLKPSHSVADVLRSPWAQPSERKETTDRVLRSTKLEDSIYSDLRSQDETTIPVLEKECCEKMNSFPSLSRDVFQACYSLLPKQIDESQMSASAKKFSAPILEHIQQSEDFPTLKSICEGRELPAYHL